MEYKLIERKTVYDFDGFTTEYSWYKCLDSGENIFIFGDSDFYTPENTEPDYETSDDEVAREWFDSYEGFESMDLDEDVATATSGDLLDGEFSVDGNTFVDENGEKHPVNDGGEVIMDEIIDEGIIDRVHRFTDKLKGKSAKEIELNSAARAQKKEMKKFEKVLAQDFNIDHKDAKYYIDHDYKKPFDYAEWKDKFGGDLDINSKEYEQWFNAIVTTPDGYYIRKGAEDFSKKLVRLLPGKNDKLNSMYEFKPAETSEESSSDKVEESLLTEEPLITLRDDELNDPKEFDLKNAIQQRVDDEKKAKEEAEAAEKLAKIKEKAAPIFDEFKNSPDPLETAFENLVPNSGKAETVAGEIVRAMMRVLYRDYNDGDKFFMGYGLETCGGSIVYLMDVIGEKFESKVDNILQDAYRFTSDFPDDLYTKAINELKDIVVDYLLDHEELFATENTEDSREYDYDYLEENQPRFEFEIDACDEIYELIQHEVIDSNDLYNYVDDALSYDSIYRDAEIERPWGRDSSSIVVSNLTIDAYEELRDMCRNDRLNRFWSDLIDEYSEELEAIENGEYDTDDLEDLDEEE